MQNTIFLSHSSKDKDIALALKEQLETYLAEINPKIYVTSAPDGIATGKKWFEDVMSNLAAADCMIVLVTPNSVDSRWVNFEYGYFWSKNEDAIYPLRVPQLQELPSPLDAKQDKLLTDIAHFEAFLKDILKQFDISDPDLPPINLQSIIESIKKTPFEHLLFHQMKSRINDLAVTSVERIRYEDLWEEALDYHRGIELIDLRGVQSIPSPK